MHIKLCFLIFFKISFEISFMRRFWFTNNFPPFEKSICFFLLATYLDFS